ncbi:hypothetical protein F5Y15DRAFT_415884 [Xylariaceae sp. FL0016]|nr:hypothetical protein F5Y15DRAFT_415884 [Xylariaceae sp. FL0016]
MRIFKPSPISGSTVPIGALFSLALSHALAVSLPPPTGPYYVGITRQTIEHYNDNDPLAPNNISTAFLATIFYPTTQESQEDPKPYLQPETASMIEVAWGYPNGSLAAITSTLQEDAPFLRDISGPTLLFGPGGGGPPAEANTILLAELASYGYTVIGIDHPFEQPFLRYSNGTGVVGVDVDYSSQDLLDAIYATRILDNSVVLSCLPDLAERLGAPFSTSSVGAFGYSLGGAAALGSMYDSPAIAAGLNMDGGMYPRQNSSTPAADVGRAVMQLGEELHVSQPDGIDITWYNFRKEQTGPYYEVVVNGTLHHDFCDNAFWKSEFPDNSGSGTIDGKRQTVIMNTFVKAFFDVTLLGKNSSLLDGPSDAWPEITHYDRSGNVID